jgi:SAM-dependent methyltransferase
VSDARALEQRYGARAADYERFWAPVLLAFAEPLVESVPGGDVLDLGCGVGVFGARIAERGARVTGIDASPGMLARAPLDARVAGDVTRLPFADATLDAAVSTFVLQHVARPRAAFRECARVVRGGGRVLTATWSGDARCGDPSIHVVRALDALGAPPVPFAKTWHELVDSPAKMRRIARACGFEVERAWTERRAYGFSADDLYGFSIGMGASQRRLASFEPALRSRALQEVRRVVGELSDAERTYAPEVVFCVARRP